MILSGNNLGERHRNLNRKVSETAARKTNFGRLKSQPEKCDVDKLFKIDLASKYKDIDYILEVLKCGDVFYITRALKCLWLYSDEYSQFINPDYLVNNVFPSMSMKMERKMLTAISIYMRNAVRAIKFYEYCMNDNLIDYAHKFLVFTPDSFKLNLLTTKKISYFNDSKFLKQFVGSSFQLALGYLAVRKYSSNTILELRFLYSLSEEKYLDILEHITYHQGSRRLGLRLSKDILNKHKQRVYNKPLLYINVLNKRMLVKHLTVQDVKSLSPSLLPKTCDDFWSIDFYSTYKFLLEKLPASKVYVYMRQIYKSKYNGAEFEMTIEFYNLKYYDMFNIEEREAWALQHIERDLELPGISNYMWYKFVKFSKAFPAIRHYIFLTPDKDERSQIVNVLPETARSQVDVNELLFYYNETHVNESEEHKESFINKVIECHDIYSFNEQCWRLLDQLFYSINVYTTRYTKPHYKFRSFIYHIIHSKNLPEMIKEFYESLEQFFYYETIIKELCEEREAVVAEYMLNWEAEKIKSLMDHPDYDKVQESNEWEYGTIKSQIQEAVCKVWCILYTFNKPNEDCPEIVIQFMESNMDIYQYHEMYKPKFEKKTEDDFVRWLKQDINMAIDGIYEIRCNTYRWNFRLCRLFRKLKVYFPNDVGKEYLDYFLEYLEAVPQGYREYRNIKMAIVGVFCLADQECIINLLEKYVPATPKIDRMNMDNRVFQVQKAICRLAYHPRPPLPLSNIQKYIIGDYVNFCAPVFYNYLANLSSIEKFIDGLLDGPLSIQKHGLRLAFRAYETHLLIPVIQSAWKKTHNVSLRMVLYEALFDRILNESEDDQKVLYEVLKQFTTELNHDDHDNVFSILVSHDLPDVFKGDFIETAWGIVSKLSDKIDDLKRKISVICHMETYIHLVQRDFPRLQIIDDHIRDMLCDKNINKDLDRDDEYYFEELANAKWELTEKYIVSFKTEAEQQESIELVQLIMTESLQSWDLVKDNTYTLRKFIRKFIGKVMHKDPKSIENCAKIIPIYQCILHNFELYLKQEELYHLMRWELTLSVVSRNIINDGRKKADNETDEPSNVSNKEIGISFGIEVAKIINKRVKENQFYHCFYQTFANIVKSIGRTMCRILGISRIGFVYYVCEGLINFKMTETYLLALFMLPVYPDSNWKSEHRDIISNINKSDCLEVRSYLYEKYVLFDYKVRSYVL